MLEYIFPYNRFSSSCQNIALPSLVTTVLTLFNLKRRLSIENQFVNHLNMLCDLVENFNNCDVVNVNITL